MVCVCAYVVRVIMGMRYCGVVLAMRSLRRCVRCMYAWCVRCVHCVCARRDLRWSVNVILPQRYPHCYGGKLRKTERGGRGEWKVSSCTPTGRPLYHSRARGSSRALAWMTHRIIHQDQQLHSLVGSCYPPITSNKSDGSPADLQSIHSHAFFNLPTHVLLHIFSFLNHKELIFLSILCPTLKRFMDDPVNSVWSHLIIHDHGDSVHHQSYFDLAMLQRHKGKQLFANLKHLLLAHEPCRAAFRDHESAHRAVCIP